MQTALYFSANYLRIAVGAVGNSIATIDEFYELELPTRTMINGIITDKDAMTHFLQNAASQYGPFHKDAVLVMESNNIRTKLMTLPKVKESKLRAFVQQDYGEIGTEEGDVFDFTVMGPGSEGGLEVLGVAAGRVLLQNYIDVMDVSGFKLKRIDVGINALAKLSRLIAPLQKDSSILIIVDDNIMAITLYEHGVYRILQKYRFLNPTGTPERRREAASNLSSMVQFQKSQRTNIQIDAVYVIGAPQDTLAPFVETTRFLEIPVYELNLDKLIKLTGKAHFNQEFFTCSKYLLNIGAMMRK